MLDDADTRDSGASLPPGFLRVLTARSLRSRAHTGAPARPAAGRSTATGGGARDGGSGAPGGQSGHDSD